MPNITVQMFPGRDEKLKKELADKLREVAVEQIHCSSEDLSVAVVDVDPADWNEKVADKVKPEDVKAGKMYRSK